MAYEFEGPVPLLSPQLIKETAAALKRAATRMKSAGNDESLARRWLAYGARAALRLSEAGYQEFNVFLAARPIDHGLANVRLSPSTGEPFPGSLASTWRHQQAEWIGFSCAASLLRNIAKSWFPEMFPPANREESQKLSMLDVRIAYTALAAHLVENCDDSKSNKRLTFDQLTLSITLDGKSATINNPKAFQIVKFLWKRIGKKTTRAHIRKAIAGLGASNAISDVLKELPSFIRDCIKSSTQRGFWIVLPKKCQ
jgi:hypothetical protein